MTGKKKTLVVGSGTLGFAIFLVLLRNGHKVELWDKDWKEIFEYPPQGGGTYICNRYEYMKDKSFSIPRNRIIKHDGRIDATGYDFIILATSMSGLNPVLGLIDNLDEEKTTLVTVQKGLTESMQTPYFVVRSKFKKVAIIQFTGAGFGKGIVQGHQTRMVIAHNWRYLRQAKIFQILFRNTNIWPRLSQDPTGMCHGGVLRTIASCQMAIVQERFQNEPETLAAIMAGIEDEHWRLLKVVGAKLSTRKDGSPERKTLLSDLRLCQHGGRNTDFGMNIAQGMTIPQALKEAEKKGVVESYENIKLAFKLVYINLFKGEGAMEVGSSNIISREFPFLASHYDLIWNGKSLEQCIQDIRSRQEFCF